MQHPNAVLQVQHSSGVLQVQHSSGVLQVQHSNAVLRVAGAAGTVAGGRQAPGYRQQGGQQTEGGDAVAEQRPRFPQPAGSCRGDYSWRRAASQPQGEICSCC